MEIPIEWFLTQASPQEMDAAAGLLSPGEQQRLAGMRFAKRRADWLSGRVAAKELLLRCHPVCCGLTPQEIEIDNEPQGAPFARVGGQRLKGWLSISHCAGLALAGWSQQPFGLDVELIEARHPAFLADYFTPGEIAAADACAPELHPVWVTLAWSAKESALKALGQGLRLDTRQVEIGMPAGLALSMDAQALDWQPLPVSCALVGAGKLRGWWTGSKKFVFTAVQGIGAVNE